MAGICLGVIIFFIGAFVLIVNRNKEVSMNGDFYEMPIQIKFGILCVILGILSICGSVIFVLLTNPAILISE